MKTSARPRSISRAPSPPSARFAQSLPRLALALSSMTMALGLAGCAGTVSTGEIQRATAIASTLRYEVPEIARQPCVGAPLPDRSRGDVGEIAYQEFGLAEAGYLEACETKRATAIAAGDVVNYRGEYITANLRPPSLGERITGKRKIPKPPPVTIDDILARTP